VIAELEGGRPDRGGVHVFADVAVTLASAGTLTALDAGLVEVTVGGVVSSVDAFMSAAISVAVNAWS